MKKKVTMFIVIAAMVAASHAFAGELKTTQDGYFAAVSEKAFEKTIMYSSAGDKKAVGMMLALNQVFILKGGIKVYVVDFIFPGKIKIRVPGETGEFWTFAEAVK